MVAEERKLFVALMTAYSMGKVNEFDGLCVVLYLYGKSRKMSRLNFD